MESMTPKDAYRTTDPNYQPVERESWKDMAQNLYSDINALWQKERQLIQTELNEKMSEVKVAAGSFATGGGVLFVGLFAAVATAIIALDVVLPLWASALIVTTVLFIVGGVMMAAAKKKFEAQRLKPKHSIDTVNEIKNTLQERFHEFKRH